MKVRVTAILAVLALLVGAIPALAQVQTGEITGRVSDDTGAVLPGATVTLTSPVLIQPQTATSSETGSFRFTLIPIGTYSVKFELPGFKTVVREGIVVNIGFTAQVNQQLAISTVQETVTVSGESPIVDTKATTAKTTFDLETLQNIPSARDPWVMLQRVPSISMDRVNVGGSQSGQQSGYISRGGTTGNNKWSLDGVDITDMSATGASPIYYDFDMLQEMQVTTGGADASQQTGGVGINFVTRSGTNRFKGSGRIYNTNDAFEADNVTDEIRAQGARLGRADSEHQRLRLRGRRPDQARQALVLGQLRQAGHQGRRGELLQADTDLPAPRRSGFGRSRRRSAAPKRFAIAWRPTSRRSTTTTPS